MARVRYPFLVRYTSLVNQAVTYGQEKDGNDFERVDDPLLATVYRDLKMFRKGFEKSPTQYVKDFNSNEFRWDSVELVYVGE